MIHLFRAQVVKVNKEIHTIDSTSIIRITRLEI